MSLPPPYYGCSGCATSAGILGCPTHAHTVYGSPVNARYPMTQGVPHTPHDFEPMRGPDDTTCARCLAPHPSTPDPTAAGRPESRFGSMPTCPCAGMCHHGEHPCSLGCLAQGRAEALDEPKHAPDCASLFVYACTCPAALGGNPDD